MTLKYIFNVDDNIWCGHEGHHNSQWGETFQQRGGICIKFESSTKKRREEGRTMQAGNEKEARDVIAFVCCWKITVYHSDLIFLMMLSRHPAQKASIESVFISKDPQLMPYGGNLSRCAIKKRENLSHKMEIENSAKATENVSSNESETRLQTKLVDCNMARLDSIGDSLKICIGM